MPKLNTILEALESYMPLHLSEEWDNTGLMTGNRNAEVRKVIVALDCTDFVVDEAIACNANLIVTHHPLIFGGIKRIDEDDTVGRKLIKLIKNDINVISMHTNLDKADGGVNDTLCELLELNNIENLTDKDASIGRCGETKKPYLLKDFVKYVSEKLDADGIRYAGDDKKEINRVSVVSGSGSEFFFDALKKNSDVFITSEVKHHIGIEALECGVAIIDAGHFETENIITGKIKKLLEDNFDVEVKVSESYTKLFKTV